MNDKREIGIAIYDMKGTRSRSQYCFWKFILLSALFLNITIAHAQSGNQMLDGIGETDTQADTPANLSDRMLREPEHTLVTERVHTRILAEKI